MKLTNKITCLNRENQSEVYECEIGRASRSPGTEITSSQLFFSLFFLLLSPIYFLGFFKNFRDFSYFLGFFCIEKYWKIRVNRLDDDLIKSVYWMAQDQVKSQPNWSSQTGRLYGPRVRVTGRHTDLSHAKMMLFVNGYKISFSYFFLIFCLFFFFTFFGFSLSKNESFSLYPLTPMIERHALPCVAVLQRSFQVEK